MRQSRDKQESIKSVLAELVAIPSTYPDEAAVGSYVAQYLEKLGFYIQLIPTSEGRNNIIATYGAADKYLAFYGHLDTVEPDAHYEKDPHTIWTEGDKAHGLGAADMKGGICAMLHFAQYAVQTKKPVKLVFGVDEEAISEGAHDLVDSELLESVDFLISAESGQSEGINQDYSVCYGRRGRIGLEIEVFGRKKHAAENTKAINAVEHAATLITHFPKINFKQNAHFGKTVFVVHSISGDTDSFSVPDNCVITLSALTAPNTSHDEVIRKLQKLAAELDVDAEIRPLERKTPYAESYEVQTSDFLKTVETKLFKPNNISISYSDSVADENIFATRLNIPVISMGPIGGGDHTVNEWVSLASIDKLIDGYAAVLDLYATV